MTKPFCFRCGAAVSEHGYQVTLRVRANAETTQGPIWQVCAPCIRDIPWTEIICDTVRYEEKRLRKEQRLDEEERLDEEQRRRLIWDGTWTWEEVYFLPQ